MTNNDNKDPQFILLPEAQAQVDADPRLKEAMPEIAATLKNAMQGVKDGRYKSFEDAIEAMTGSRPERVDLPPPGYKHGPYLSVGPDEQNPGKVIAVVTDGHPQRGHKDVTILDVNRFDTEEEANAWGERVIEEEPWNRRN